jgi:hypothetical protein
MELTTEYLIIIEKKSSEALFQLCDSVDEFNRLLKANTDIRIQNNSIKFRNNLFFRYFVKEGDVKGKDQRYFHLKIGFDDKEENIQEFTDLLKAIRSTVHKMHARPETLWDDLSLYYSTQAYPYIHNIENQMRKLIAYFMLTNVGKEWVRETTPRDVKEAIDKSKRKPETRESYEYLDVLYQVDFIHLGDFLFKPYQTKTTEELYTKLKGIKRPDELDLVELKDYMPRSNWDRYFSEIVAYDGAQFRNKWERLYELRCIVAHNALMRSSEFSDIVNLSKEVAENLQNALDNLDKINVPEEEKESVAENVISNLSRYNQEFIELWKTFEEVLDRVEVDLESSAADLQIYEPLAILRALYDNQLMSEQLFNEGKQLINFRNQLVHGVPTSIHEHEIEALTHRLERYISDLKSALGLTSLHAEYISRLEKHLGQNLIKRSQTTYTTENDSMRLSCAVSKAYGEGDQVQYWFGFHRSQKQFLEAAPKSYVAFGCGTENKLVLIPFEEFSKFLDYMSVTERKNRYYWHVHISQRDGLVLLLSGHEFINLDQYLVA